MNFAYLYFLSTSTGHQIGHISTSPVRLVSVHSLIARQLQTSQVWAEPAWPSAAPKHMLCSYSAVMAQTLQKYNYICYHLYSQI